MPGNINTFFSTIVSDPAAATDGGNSTTTTSSTRSTMRMSRRTTGNSSWIVSELQQAQQQISQALQTPLDAPPTGAGPDFYMHPRQSMFADLEFLHSRPHATSHATSHAASHHVTSLSETLGANAMSTESEGRHGGERTRRPSDDLIESYLNAEAEGGNIDDASMSFDPSALLRFNIHDLGSNQGAPLPLHHALRNAAAIHNSVGMTVQSLRPHGAITGLHNNNIGNVAGGTRTMNPASNTALRNKIVYRLNCAYCCTPVCERAMRAILLADTKIELYSTDIPPRALRTMDDDRLTKGCNCRIRDTVCSGWYRLFSLPCMH